MKLINTFVKGFAAIILSIPTFVYALNAYALSAEEIYKKVNQSVYTIYTVNFYEKKPVSLGSAIAVTNHILATNCHVALTGNYLGVMINNDFKLGTLFFRDPSRDICFVEVPGVTFSPVKIRDSKDVKVGESVYAIGNPEGLEKSISQGIISNKRKDRGGYVLQTDASVSFGSSGGGLFDQNGYLIGITNSIDKDSRKIAFALPTEWITQILFPKAEAKEEKPLPVAENGKSLKKISNYGKDNVALYQTNKRCLIYFVGKNDNGSTIASAIWYPAKPEIIIIFPNTADINQAFRIMNKVFFDDNNDDNPIYSKNYLLLKDKRYELIGVKDQDGKFPLLVTKLPPDIKDRLLQLENFQVKYEDEATVIGFDTERFGLNGLKEALDAYAKNCKDVESSNTEK